MNTIIELKKVLWDKEKKSSKHTSEKIVVCLQKKLGHGRSIQAYEGIIIESADPSMKNKKVILKKIIVKDRGHYEEDVKAYSENFESYVELSNIGSSFVAQFWGVFCDEKDEVYVLQEYRSGELYKDLIVPKDKKLLKELTIARNVCFALAKFLDNKIHILDLKDDNLIIQEQENDDVNVVFFDLDVFHQESGGTLTFNKRYQRVLEQYDDISIKEVVAVSLLLYERLFGKLPNRKSASNFSRYCYQVEEYPYCSSSVNLRLKDMFERVFEKEIIHPRELAGEIQKTINILEKSSKIELKNHIPFLSSLPIGRDDEIQMIEKELEKKKYLFIYGPGGVGKTSVLMKYAHSKAHSKKCYYIPFQSTMKDTILYECKFYDYNDEVLLEKMELETVYQAKMELLKQIDENTLLIIDDVYSQNWQSLEEMWSNEPEFAELVNFCNAKILFSTRYNMGNLGIKIGELSKEDAFKLFCYYGGEVQDKEAINQLIILLQQNAFLLKLFGIIMRDNFYGIDEVLRLVRKKDYNQVPDVFLTNGIDGEREVVEHIASVFRFPKIDRFEKRILLFLAIIPGIKVEINLFSELLGGMEARIEYKKAFQRMIQKGWLDSQDYTFVILHKLMAEAIKIKFADTYIDLIPFFKNYLLYKYDRRTTMRVSSYAVKRLLNLLLMYKVGEEGEAFVKQIFDEFFNPNIYAMVAFAVGNQYLFNKVMKRAYASIKRSVTCMIGKGMHKCYAFFYDGEELLATEIFDSIGAEWGGAAIWSWSNEECTLQHHFVFHSLINVSIDNESENIVINEIADRCFERNANIDMFVWEYSEDDMGKRVELERIGKYAFSQSNIMAFRTSSSILNKIEEGCFCSCKKLIYVCFDQSKIEYINDYAFRACDNLMRVLYETSNRKLRIGISAFRGCLYLEYIVSETAILSIAFLKKNAFMRCVSLNNSIELLVANIESSVFEDCWNISSIQMHNTKEIGEKAFLNCKGLQEIVIPETVKVIGEKAFDGTCLKKNEDKSKGIIKVELNNIASECDTEHILERAISKLFGKKKSLYTIVPVEEMKSVLEISTMEIEKNRYRGNVYPQEVILKQKTKINSYAFAQCSSLCKINWEQIDEIKEGVFRGCNFTEVKWNKPYVSRECFMENVQLTTVQMMGKDIVLDDRAFYSCFNLRNITTKNICDIGEEALAGTSIEILYFDNLTFIRKAAFLACQELKEIYINSERLTIASDAFYGCENLTLYINCEGTVDIESNAFPENSIIYVLENSSIDMYAQKERLLHFIPIKEEYMEEAKKNILEKYILRTSS